MDFKNQKTTESLRLNFKIFTSLLSTYLFLIVSHGKWKIARLSLCWSNKASLKAQNQMGLKVSKRPRTLKLLFIVYKYRKSLLLFFMNFYFDKVSFYLYSDVPHASFYQNKLYCALKRHFYYYCTCVKIKLPVSSIFLFYNKFKVQFQAMHVVWVFERYKDKFLLTLKMTARVSFENAT